MLDHCVEDCLAGHAFLEQTQFRGRRFVLRGAPCAASTPPLQRGLEAGLVHPAYKYSIIVGV